MAQYEQRRGLHRLLSSWPRLPGEITSRRAQHVRIRRAGRFFESGHNSGPLSWHSDGRWWTIERIRGQLLAAQKSLASGDWYDVHAALD
jgi:hypothetical protein